VFGRTAGQHRIIGGVWRVPEGGLANSPAEREIFLVKEVLGARMKVTGLRVSTVNYVR
jgi:hypothetical protein